MGQAMYRCLGSHFTLIPVVRQVERNYKMLGVDQGQPGNAAGVASLPLSRPLLNLKVQRDLWFRLRLCVFNPEVKASPSRKENYML